ncbi:bacterioferritin [Spongiactinospora sp. TRM90649]|uniref:bacterioferritin n=1 Tax=Spongiactinospora sp. TRM90649 TaxID=3031114 RepID=UPI0023F83745|nr:bacterioferritin [Spongiactinospora sp. TRM90649]MDF5751228.1 bacterioferritin [Spongiactinospora sp. TRM90649]
MQGDKQIIELLNEQLTSELTAINQYFLHAKMQENWGYFKLAEHTRAESFEEMRHAERLTDRILFLEGLPNYQRLGTIAVGQTVPEQLQADLDLELGVIKRLKPAIILMREKGDATSARIFEDILEDEEKHIDYLETELGLIQSLGEQLYLARFAEPPSGDD